MQIGATPQRPLDTDFGARTTAAEVLAGVELSGRLAIVTGGYSGLGLETGAGRRRRRRRGAGQAPRGCRCGAPRHRITTVGRVGHGGRVGPGRPRVGARVVALSSTGHKLSPIRFDDPQFETGYDKWQAYGQAKTANSLFAVRLDALGRPAGVRAFAVHPGGIMTQLQRHLPREEMVASGWMDDQGRVNDRFKTPQQGAATSVWAATSARLTGMGGVYCEDCDIAAPTEPGSPTARFAGVDAAAIDPDAAARLRTMSAELTGVDAFS